MANIMINKICNLHCPYCFADEFVNDPEQIAAKNNKGNITIDNFKKAVEFVLRTDDGIRLIGGETMLHPELPNMLNMLIEDDRVKNIHLFTNGVFLDRHMELLKNEKVTMLINLNSPKDIGERNYEKIINNLDELNKDSNNQGKFTLGFNMYKVDFDYTYMIDAIKRYNKKHVRTSICVPNTKEGKYKSSLEYFHIMKRSVFDFFKELEKIGTMPTYDCNTMPVCVMTYDEKEWLKNFWKLEDETGMFCNIIEENMCCPVIDILPDLTAVRCFGLSDEAKINIEDFNNLEEIVEYFKNIFDCFAFNIYNDPKCEYCNKRKQGNCMGGCLAFKSEKIKRAREFSNNL